MNTGTYIFSGILILFAVIILIVTAKTGRFVKNLFLSSISGIGALLALNLLTDITCVSVAINPISLAVSAVFGISGVISLVVSQLLV